MKKLFKIIIAIIISLYGLLIFCAEILNLEPKDSDFEANKLEISFEEAVKKIAALNNRGKFLYEIDECLSIIKYCDLYLDKAISILNKNILSEDEVFIILQMMQFLNYNNYIKFFNACAELYVKDILYTYQIAYVMNSNFYLNNKIIKSFYKPKVIKSLLMIKKKANLPEFNITVNQILSGYPWLYLLLTYPFRNKDD